MRKYAVKAVVMMALFMLSSCLATQPSQPIPALIERPSADTRLLLESNIGQLLNSQPIKLSNNVFVQKSTVIIDRHQPKDSRGNLLDGREVRQADTVSLLLENGKCYLKHEQSGNIKLVDGISCKAK